MWDRNAKDWSSYRTVYAPVDEYCSSDGYSVWESRVSGQVRVRQEDGQIRTFSVGRKSSDRRGGYCEG